MLELGSLHLLQGHLDRTLDCYERALGLAEDLALPHRAALAHNALGYALTLIGDHDEARRSLARCLRFAGYGAHPALESDACVHRARLRRQTGDLVGADADLTRAEAVLGGQIHPPLMTLAAIERARLAAAQDRPRQASAAARDALRLACDNRLPWYEAAARTTVAHVLDGHPALAEARRGRTIAAELGADLLEAEALTIEAALEERFGEPAIAAERIERAAMIVDTIARSLGRRQRMFRSTPPALAASAGRRERASTPT